MLTINARRRKLGNVLRVDPSRTITLRKQYARELRQRFAKLDLAIWQLLVEEDALGLLPGAVDPLALNASGCGAGAEGSPGFQPGNTCGKGDGKRSVAATKSKIAGKLVDANGKEIGLDDEFVVYHRTSRENAERLKSGFKVGDKKSKAATIIKDEAVAKALGKRVGDTLDYEPGRGLGAGLSVGPDPDTLKHYGDVILEIKVTRRDLAIPPERKTARMTPEKALLLDDGYLPNDIPTEKIRVLNSQVLNVGQWKLFPDADKLRAFKGWLKTQVGKLIFRNKDESADDAIWNRYAEAGLRKGALRSFNDWLRGEKAKGRVPEKEMLPFYGGSQEQFLRTAFTQPVAKEKLQILAAKSYDDLHGITEAMSTQISRTMVEGLAQGQHPKEIARNISKSVKGIGQARAELLAQTSIIETHAQGQLLALEQMGVEEIGVMVEWSTARDNKVCPMCKPMEGVVLTVEEAKKVKIPRHPRCRCAFTPAGLGEDTTGQKRSRAQIVSAIRQSLKRDKGSQWTGADVKIAKSRPRSIMNNRMPLWLQVLDNAFCPTGKGGGIDPTCSPNGGQKNRYSSGQPKVIYHTFESDVGHKLGGDVPSRGVFGLPDSDEPNEYGDKVVAVHLKEVPREKIFTASDQFAAVKKLFGQRDVVKYERLADANLLKAYREMDEKIAGHLRKSGTELIQYTSTEQYGEEWVVLDKGPVQDLSVNVLSYRKRRRHRPDVLAEDRQRW